MELLEKEIKKKNYHTEPNSKSLPIHYYNLVRSKVYSRKPPTFGWGKYYN